MCVHHLLFLFGLQEVNRHHVSSSCYHGEGEREEGYKERAVQRKRGGEILQTINDKVTFSYSIV